MPDFDAPDLAAVRDRFRELDFSVDGVFDLLGATAHHALGRNETTPARRICRDGGPLGTLIRLFQLQDDLDRREVEAALGTLIDPLVAWGVLGVDGDQVRALVDVRPYGDEQHDWWIVCDLTPGLDQRPVEVGPDHVLGISEASTSLAQLTTREPVQSALDLGAGCGVQALHLSTHSAAVVATDVNRRALWAARLTAALNDVVIDVRDGSLFEPVAGERFDLISTNPPFVVSPPSAERLVYRESSLPADAVVQSIVEGAPAHLNSGGRAQILAAWVHRRGQDWRERLSGWIEPTGLDAWAVQREVVDLPSYTEMWLADAGVRGRPDYPQVYDQWLSWFDEQGIESMGFGWITLRAAGRDVPHLRLESWDGPVRAPMAPAVIAQERRVDALAASAGEDLLARRFTLAEGVVQETVGRPGADDPERIVLRTGAVGPLRSRQVDTIQAALVGASDGELTLGQIAAALASLLAADPVAIADQCRAGVADLLAEGFLDPA